MNIELEICVTGERILLKHKLEEIWPADICNNNKKPDNSVVITSLPPTLTVHQIVGGEYWSWLNLPVRAVSLDVEVLSATGHGVSHG